MSALQEALHVFFFFKLLWQLFLQHVAAASCLHAKFLWPHKDGSW